MEKTKSGNQPLGSTVTGLMSSSAMKSLLGSCRGYHSCEYVKEKRARERRERKTGEPHRQRQTEWLVTRFTVFFYFYTGVVSYVFKIKSTWLN